MCCSETVNATVFRQQDCPYWPTVPIGRTCSGVATLVVDVEKKHSGWIGSPCHGSGNDQVRRSAKDNVEISCRIKTHRNTALGRTSALYSELSEVMIDVKVSVPHPLSPGHSPHPAMGSKFAGRAAESIKQPAECFHIGCKFNWLSTGLLLIQFRPRLNAVRPRKGTPQCHPLVDRALKQRRRIGEGLLT